VNRLVAPAIVAAHGLDFATFALLVTLYPALIGAEANGIAVVAFRAGGLLGVLALKAGALAIILSRLANVASMESPAALYVRTVRIVIGVAIGVGLLGLVANLSALAVVL
jgi:hypothetical protein